MSTSLSLTPSAEWLTPKGDGLVIAGPCSVETPGQVYETVKQLAETGKVDIIRGGIWKPRTRPGAFEGVGEEGLPLLTESARAFGLPCMTEVATPDHVEAALRHNVDMVWIGARTTVNPFSVQAIADALRGTEIPVWVKNPVNPDLGLWLGAVERLAGVGLKKIGLIHRGFTPLGDTPLRNLPEWSLALKMRENMPEAPMVSDPSHIAGRRDLLASITRKAHELCMDGWMIESHVAPHEAWSDAKQQIVPSALPTLLAEALHEKQAHATGLLPQLEALMQTLENRLQQIRVLAGAQQEEQVLRVLAEEGLSVQ
ncbi:MAG TPA: 3-deoxy-7-phosphoheptulonate synthase [Cytophagales bacterium]|nr:3-deoxy-7-phosphoheptulonate synthase [Cytophagales bacterium]HAA22147.1 3-deoxy-7-phosphoheptulonate synthase [Cytophagales bacterium]HAP63499.1 3-deoxy-7-phosphoheptulonate synthase [Cytophagales bacterium]